MFNGAAAVVQVEAPQSAALAGDDAEASEWESASEDEDSAGASETVRDSQ